MSEPIRPAITRKGQPYVDEPVIVQPRIPGGVEDAVTRCFHSAQEMARERPRPIQVAWQKVNLNWVSPKEARK